MSGVDPVYQEVVDESEEIESTGHVTVEGDPRNFIKNFRDKYENHPNMFFPTYKRLVDGEEVETPDASEKARNVETLSQAQEDIDFNHPALIYRDGTYSEFEFIPGDTLEEELEASVDDIGELGQDVGEMTANLHENGFARYDNRVGNIIVDRSGIEDSEPVPYFIDGEYVETDAQEGDINLDLVAFMDSINDQDLEEFREFFSGFREGYGQVPDSSIGLAGIRTVAERTLEKDVGKSVKAVMNTLTAFYINNTK